MSKTRVRWVTVNILQPTHATALSILQQPFNAPLDHQILVFATREVSRGGSDVEKCAREGLCISVSGIVEALNSWHWQWFDAVVV